jgi:legumain
MHKMGIPDEHIIVMMYDDIAGYSRNPMPGKIINTPGGEDVYAGVPKDYTGRLVTAENFLKIISGDTMTVGSGKSLKTTAEDNVFIFFDDHGSEGALCFPTGGCPLSGPKIQNALEELASKKMYKRVVFYVEACFAGSNFYKQTLPKGVYVATASPVGESSFAYNWDNKVGAYVADIFAFLFVDDTENHPLTRSFTEQFHYIQDNIQNYSQACQYGDKAWADSTTLASFYGASRAQRASGKVRPHPQITDAVSVFDVPVESALRIYRENPTEENRAEYEKQLAIKNEIDAHAARIIQAAMPAKPHLASPACYTCDRTCQCYKYCISEHNDKYCALECCNEEGCYTDPKKFTNGASYDLCLRKLTSAYLDRCGNDHPYLRSTELLFRRACRNADINMEAALLAIRQECHAFNKRF